MACLLLLLLLVCKVVWVVGMAASSGLFHSYFAVLVYLLAGDAMVTLPYYTKDALERKRSVQVV